MLLTALDRLEAHVAVGDDLLDSNGVEAGEISVVIADETHRVDRVLAFSALFMS